MKNAADLHIKDFKKSKKPQKSNLKSQKIYWAPIQVYKFFNPSTQVHNLESRFPNLFITGSNRRLGTGSQKVLQGPYFSPYSNPKPLKRLKKSIPVEIQLSL